MNSKLASLRWKWVLGVVTAAVIVFAVIWHHSRVRRLEIKVATVADRLDNLRSYLADSTTNGVGPKGANTAFYTWLVRMDSRVKTVTTDTHGEGTGGPPPSTSGGPDTHGPPPPPPDW